MSLVAGRPQPSSWAYRMNGCADKIHGHDDGEAEMEHRDIPAAPFTFQHNELEVLEDIELLTKNNQ